MAQFAHLPIYKKAYDLTLFMRGFVYCKELTYYNDICPLKNHLVKSYQI